MGNDLETGFQSKYERNEHLEIAGASLTELQALERKYANALTSDEYAFSKNPNEEGYRIFSRLLLIVRDKIKQVESERHDVSVWTGKERRELATEIRKNLPKKASATARSEAKDWVPKPSEPDDAPKFVQVPLAKNPDESRPAVQKPNLWGISGWMNAALKDASDMASKIFQKTK